MMLLFRQDTGEPAAVLMDEGKLTDIRTAIAGPSAPSTLPREVERIGIVDCRKVLVWGRGEEELRRYRENMEREGFALEGTRDASRILARADLVVAGSRRQCRERGEIHHALERGLISEDDVMELGEVIAGEAPDRTSGEEITVADLTGVAVQDIKIAADVYEALRSRGP